MNRLAALALTLPLLACATETRQVVVDTQRVLTIRNSYANAHLLLQGDRALLVDSGTPEDADDLADDVAEELADAGIPGANLTVVITHGHADHAGGALRLRERLGARIVAGRGDEPQLASGRNEKLCPTGDIAESQLEDYQDLPYTPTTPDAWVEQATPLAELAGIAGQVVPLPGHTPGSLVVVVGRAAFVGDLLRGAIIGAGAERHFYMCDLEDNVRDIQALLDTIAPDATRFFTGHFGPVERDDVQALLEDLR